jgi:hypothetical protein
MCGDIHVLYNQVCNVYVKSLKPAVHPNNAKIVSRFFPTHSAASPSKKTGGFISFRRTMVVYFENPTKHENSFREQTAGVLNVKVGGNNKHCVLNS